MKRTRTLPLARCLVDGQFQTRRGRGRRTASYSAARHAYVREFSSAGTPGYNKLLSREMAGNFVKPTVSAGLEQQRYRQCGNSHDLAEWTAASAAAPIRSRQRLHRPWLGQCRQPGVGRGIAKLRRRPLGPIRCGSLPTWASMDYGLVDQLSKRREVEDIVDEALLSELETDTESDDSISDLKHVKPRAEVQAAPIRSAEPASAFANGRCNERLASCRWQAWRPIANCAGTDNSVNQMSCKH